MQIPITAIQNRRQLTFIYCISQIISFCGSFNRFCLQPSNAFSISSRPKRQHNTVLTPMTPSRLLLLHPTNSTYSSGDAFIVLRKELGPTIVKNSPSPPEKQQPFVFATTIYNFYLLLAWVPNLRSPSRAVWISLGLAL